MDEQSAEKNPARVTAATTGDDHPSDKDLSQEIERFVEREPLDLVKCVRVFGNYYRCNWWSHSGGARTRRDYGWTGIIMDVIRKSSFLSATMQAGELTIKIVGPGAENKSHAGSGSTK